MNKLFCKSEINQTSQICLFRVNKECAKNVITNMHYILRLYKEEVNSFKTWVCSLVQLLALET